MRTYEETGPRLVVGRVGAAEEVAADRLADEMVADGVAGEWPARVLLPPPRGATIRRRASAGTGAAGGELDGPTAQAIATERHGGAPLAGAARTRMEAAFGADLSGVRVHADRRAGELCDSIRARAFAVGPHLFFRRGLPDTSTPAGRHLLAHELAHVTREAPTTAPGGGEVVRRTYLDGRDDWVGATTRFGSITGLQKGRSRQLLAVDTAVFRVQRTYLEGDIAGLPAELARLTDAIGLWRAKRPVGRARKRGEQVDALAGQVTDLSTAITSWRGTGYTAVLQAHAQQQAQVRTWLEAGRDQVQDRRLRNSCRWVLGGKAALYVVTSTADGPDRARMIRGAHAEEGETCFFPDPDSELGALGTRLPAANAYNRHNAADRANVVVGKNVNGWNKRGYVAITDVPMYSQAVFNQTLKHEVQHDADRHRETPIPDTPLAAKSYAEAVREYKTEYRAFFYQGGNDFSATHDPTNPTERHLDLRWTPRQLEIFQRIRQEYPVINKAAEDEAFVRDVNAYRNPDTEGFNKFSSPRIDDLYNRLHAVPAGTTNRAHQRVVDVLGVVDTLDADDIRYIRGQAVAVKLRAKIAHHLADDASDAFVERIVEMERRQAPPES